MCAFTLDKQEQRQLFDSYLPHLDTDDKIPPRR
jgi:hypothetical protein